MEEAEVTYTYFLVYNFSRCHHNNFFRDTISKECVVKDDCVRSCLIELQSFPLTKLYIDPIHRVFMSFPLSVCTMQDVVRSRQAYTDLLCCLSMGFTAVKNTVCLSLPKFCPPGINPEFVMECNLVAHPI